MAPRKTTRSKKKVKETEFDVTIQDTSPGSKTPVKSAKVNAMSADKALDAANGGKPASDAEVVTVKKAAPGIGKPTTTTNTGQPASTSQGVHGQMESTVLSMKAITEGVEYPYSVSLPVQFKKFLDESTIPFIEVGNTVMMRFENKNQLTEALRIFKGAKNVRTANIILEGISRSLK